MNDDDEHEGFDLTIARRRKRSSGAGKHCTNIPSSTMRTRENRARDDASSFPELVCALHPEQRA